MTAAEQRAHIIQKLEQLHPADFEGLCMDVFHYQAQFNPLYARFLELLGKNPSTIQNPDSIPFLPISFFKTHFLQTAVWPVQTVFASSGTTGQQVAQHSVRDINLYLKNTQSGFETFYGPVEDWVFLALLPNYLERGNSSLVAMVDAFIKLSRHEESSFYLYEHEKLAATLKKCQDRGKKTMLIGVSFALLDFAEAFPMDLAACAVVETGGMKGRREEVTRDELHTTLCAAFQTKEIHSEYGMTELFSQAWSKGKGIFYPSQTLQVRMMDSNDPFEEVQKHKTGTINLIDLANIDSCAFLATEDLGRDRGDGSFEILGRLDQSEWRGCNLMVGF